MRRVLSLRSQLAIWYALAFLASLVASGLVLHFTLRQILYSDLDTDLTDAAVAVVTQLSISEDGLRPSDVRRLLRSNAFVNRPASPIVTIVRDSSGTVIAGSALTNTDRLQPSPHTLERLRAGESVYETVDLPRTDDVRVYSYPVTDSAGNLIGIVQTAASTRPISGALERVEAILAIGGGASILISLAVGYWLSGLGLKPLQHVVHAARRIEASDLKRRLALKGRPAEVQELADTFDAMLARLDAAFEHQKRFVANVSHELRTPLTALRGSIDVLLLDGSLPDELRQQLERMASECGRLIRLASNVLYLAQAELGRLPERRPVDLDVLCLEVYMQMRQFRPEIGLRLRHEDQATLEGDRDLLKQLLLNLVENSLKYSRPGDTVYLDLYRDETEVRLVVEDTGPGIAPTDLPYIFEPFYRGRTSGPQVRGTGLGLAIARWAAELHGGAIEVESKLGQGTRVTVRLPTYPAGIAEPRSAVSAGPEPTTSSKTSIRPHF